MTLLVALNPPNFLVVQFNSLNKLTPSLHLNYRGFVTTTGQSAPVLSIGTLILAGSLLEFLPWHLSDRFPSSS
ncbi:hypothetical protein [Segetibacter koreensis]|uniref:hypothetical protein n=1 Tax=Segetibacter koreensis TaxID=398037 RepID=UPI001B7F8D28|nr:hypothetical protein [Segetibacter koreensis]